MPETPSPLVGSSLPVKRGHRFKDLTGVRFGRLVAQSVVSQCPTVWRCVCDCGGSKDVVTASLSSGNCASCGCLWREHFNTANRKHGLRRSREYKSWASMLQRCVNLKDAAYPRYGGRGIRVCDRWLDSFENFFSDMGVRPTGFSLERRDNGGDYTPENCIWADARSQARNRRSNRMLTFMGETLCVASWADRLGLPALVIGGRLFRGWSVERALSTPVRC